MAGKFYAVRVGKTPGIYTNWPVCESNVKGYPGAIYKSFKTREEAEAFMGNVCSEANDKKNASDTNVKNSSINDAGTVGNPLCYAFVDGSYNIATKVYGYGGFLVENEKKHVISGNGSDTEMAAMRNVAGEVLGCMAAVKLAIELEIKEVSIYYDYLGIEMWATGGWKRNKKGTIAYYEYMQSVKDIIKVNFVKVKGHSGVEGNEEADKLAKKAVGIL